MAEFETEHRIDNEATTKKSVKSKFNQMKDHLRDVKKRIRDMKDRVKAKIDRTKQRINDYQDNLHKNKVKRMDQKIERVNKHVELKGKIRDAKAAARAIKVESAKGKIADLNSKIELKRAKQKYSVDKRANHRRYAEIATKVINGDAITPEELNSYKGDANKRINYHTAAKTTRDPIKKARYQLEADLNSHSPAVRAQAVQNYQTMMNDAKIAKQEKLKDYQASRERKAMLGKEAIKAAGIAAAAKALVGQDDDN